MTNPNHRTTHLKHFWGENDEKHLVAPSLQLHGRDFVSPAELSLSVDDPAVLSLGGLFSVKVSSLFLSEA
uniref:Uncharacterized protein n=1 Tax=Rhizophagus irregularis (strain DAOM 181602 / DAOM 197198 / MUCL 43194) TaxID=747089 RepID=U9TD61_RHIID